MTAPAHAIGRSSWAHVPFGEFLQLLRRNGFAVGLQHYARMMTLLDALGPDCAPGRVRSMLAPVFATTPDQQDRFYRLCDQWFPVFVVGTIDGVRSASGDAQAVDSSMPAPSARRGVRRKQKLLPIITAVASAALVVMIAVWATRSEPPPPVEVIAPTPTAPPPVTQTPATPVPEPPPAARPEVREINWQAVRVAAALLLLIGFVLNEWRHYRRRRMVVERQRRERPPLVWPIRIEGAATPLVESSDFLTAARRLRERQTGDRERLDIEATIAATIRALGRPVLHYVKETQPPEYLVLIERASNRDHQARLYQHLIEHLAAEGVHATVYWCDEDPRICDPVGEGPSATLVELKHKFPSHRLLMFGSGDGLIDPITGRRKAWMSDTLSWPDRALLTPESPESWGARELALSGHMVVLPATLSGLQAAIDHFQIPARRDAIGRRQHGAAVPEPHPKDAVRAIKAYLGPRGLQWVCACAVYPDLQWRLTLQLGALAELSGRIDEELLVRLVRLPWFRQGNIPDEARAVLLRVIEPDVERSARRTIIALLERNPAPPETIASSRYELDLVVQKFALNSRTRANRRDLSRVARHAPRERVLSELAVLRLTEGETAPVAMRLPERLRDIFFQGGVSVLGLTSGARSVVAMALIAGVLLIGPGQDLSSEDALAESARDSAQSRLGKQTDPPTSPAVANLPGVTTGGDSGRSGQRTADSTAAATGPGAVATVPGAANSASRNAAVVPADTANRVRTTPAVGDVRPQPASDPQFGAVRLGSSTPNASLYVGGVLARELGAISPVPVPAGVPVQLSIRFPGCTAWDSVVTVAANDTVMLGLRSEACAAPVPAPATPDPAVVDRLIEDARADAMRRLPGPWATLDKAPRVTFGTPSDQQRLAAGTRVGTLTSTVRSIGTRTTGGPTVTSDSVFLTADVRFAWRTFAGANQTNDATIELVFERTATTPQLRRMHIVLRPAR